MVCPSAVPVLRQSSQQLCCNNPAKVSRDGLASVAQLGFAKAAVTQGAQASWHLPRLPYRARASPRLLGRSAGVFAFHEFCLRPQGLGGAGGPNQLLLHPCLARANMQPQGFLSASAAFDSFSSCKAPAGLFHDSLEAAPPHPGFEFCSFMAGAWLGQGRHPFSLASLILCPTPFPLSSWDCAHSPCTPASKKTVYIARKMSTSISCAGTGSSQFEGLVSQIIL